MNYVKPLSQIHPDVQKYTLAARPLAKTIETLEHQLMSPPVVATTCLSIDQSVESFLWPVASSL